MSLDSNQYRKHLELPAYPKSRGVFSRKLQLSDIIDSKGPIASSSEYPYDPRGFQWVGGSALHINNAKCGKIERDGIKWAELVHVV